MEPKDHPIILVDPTGGDLSPTEFPPDEFPDPDQNPDIELAGDQA